MAEQERKREARRTKAGVAAKRADKERLDFLRPLLRQSKTYCSCKLPIHSEKGRIRGAGGAILWWGYDVGVNQVQLEWYLAQPGFQLATRYEFSFHLSTHTSHTERA